MGVTKVVIISARQGVKYAPHIAAVVREVRGPSHRLRQDAHRGVAPTAVGVTKAAVGPRRVSPAAVLHGEQPVWVVYSGDVPVSEHPDVGVPLADLVDHADLDRRRRPEEFPSPRQRVPSAGKKTVSKVTVRRNRSARATRRARQDVGRRRVRVPQTDAQSATRIPSWSAKASPSSMSWTRLMVAPRRLVSPSGATSRASGEVHRAQRGLAPLRSGQDASVEGHVGHGRLGEVRFEQDAVLEPHLPQDRAAQVQVVDLPAADGHPPPARPVRGDGAQAGLDEHAVLQGGSDQLGPDAADVVEAAVGPAAVLQVRLGEVGAVEQALEEAGPPGVRAEPGRPW